MSSQLILHQPDGSVKSISLATGPVGVGRAASNTLSFPEDLGLSRNHLTFELEAGAPVVRDLGSKNGTLVNNERLLGARRLEPGDRISAGHLIFEFGVTRRDLSDTVVFIPTSDSGDDTARTATIMTTLEQALGGGTQVPAVNRQMQALVRAGRELAVHRPLDELFDVILGLGIDAVNATRGVLMTLESGRLRVRAAHGEGFEISGTVRDRVIRDKKSLLVRDTRLDELFKNRMSIVEQSVRSIMAVPLQTSESVIGLVYVDTSDFVRDFGPEDLNLLTVLANVAAIRIEHTRLLEVELIERTMARELQQAAEIQRQLLPAAAPDVDGLDLAGYNAACRTVGGDYYSYHVYPDGRLAIMVGDVAGKGMPASLMMANLQARAQVLLESAPGAAEMVRRLNVLISANCPGNRFITLVFAIIDPATGRLAYANAGHNPPLMVRSNGEVEWWKGGGLMLGVMGRAPYEEYDARLEPGDVLVLYTDGITEASRGADDEEFGEDRLAALVGGLLDRSAQTIADALRDAVHAWTGEQAQTDDITFVVAKKR